MQEIQDIKVYDGGNTDSYYRYTIVFPNKTFGSDHLGSLIDFESLPNSVKIYALNIIRNAGIHISANYDHHNM